MLEFLERLGRAASDAVREAFGADVPASLPIGTSTKADLQTAAALQLAKKVGKPPKEIAEVIAGALRAADGVASVEIAGAGFVNVTIADAWLAANLRGGLDLRPVGAGQRVILDYSSPNVAKPMHIGHIRSTIIGEALKRVLRAVGYDVVADNHLGDWGTQFGKLIVAYRTVVDPEAFAKSPVDELLRIYIRYNETEKAQRTEMGAKDAPAPREAAKDAPKTAAPLDDEDDAKEGAAAPPILLEARAELVKLQAGDPENVALWKRFVDVSLQEFETIYRRLDVAFDVVLGESHYNDQLAGTVDKLLEGGIAEHDHGAVIVTFDKARDGEALPPFLVRKADGGFLYGTTDVAGLLYRMKRWSPSRILIVTDERQQLHFRQLFAVGRRLGVQASLEHIWFGLMRLPEGTISTREGNLISLESLLDEGERRARVLAKEVSPDMPDDMLDRVGRAVGIGAVKYNDLSKDRTTLVTFAWDRALALTGNTAPYIQMSHARCRSLLRKAQERGFTPGNVELRTPTEREMALLLLRFSSVVEEVASSTKPHLLCEYLFQVANKLASAWEALPRILEREAADRDSLLAQFAAVADTLERGLRLLAIETPDRM